ncbi:MULTISPECIES: nitroreductase family protein [Priestia]|uniref:nitroreductase family protein n=1 Tax=Priestia TaxID=2800373 RepID=UPI001FB30E90|nr:MULTISPECIES: nitroreductase [Priestia]MCU7741399.1 nitroreductase [Priestia megaterium]
MSIDNIIKERRTVRNLKKDPIAMDKLASLLETASYAPFHSKDEPWRVITITSTEEKMHMLSAVLSSFERLGTLDGFTKEKYEQLVESYKAYFLDTPIHLIITSVLDGDAKKQFESKAATCAFIQNLQLAAWTEGIGVSWRTNSYNFDKEFQKEMCVPYNQTIVGVLHLGYPKVIPRVKVRAQPEVWTQSLSKLKNNKISS